MITNRERKWLEFLLIAASDQRLNVWHLSLIKALVLIAFLQNETNIIRVSRRKLMQFSHIETLPTYHKYFKQLQEFGYIKYIPSYHPSYRSTVELISHKIEI
ncbi:hypothetical protein EH155_15985 [Elizabethkingia anophelis]|nr:hypothetical protein [Elizabethkingia anophelis]